MSSFLIQLISWVSLTVLTVVLLVIPTAFGRSDELIRSGILSAGALILAMIGTIFFVSKEKHTVSYSLISFSIFLTLIVIFFSAFFSLSPEQSIFGFGMEVGTVISFLSLFVVYFVSLISFPNIKFLQTFYSILRITFLIFTPIVFTMAVLDTQSVVFDMFDFAVFSGLILLLSVAFGEFQKHTIYNYVVIFVASFGILLGNDRIIQVAIFVSLLLILLVKLYAKRKSEEGVPPYLSGFFAIVLLGSFFFPAVPIVQTTQPVEIRPSFQVTRIIAQDSILDNPVRSLLGSGPATFLYDWHKYKPLAINDTPLWNINFRNGFGDVPTLFITLGILGGFAFLFLFAAILYAGISGVARYVLQKEKLYVVVTAFAASLYGYILFILQIESVANLTLLFIFIGILSFITDRKKVIKVPVLVRRVVALLMLLVIAGSAFFVTTKIYDVFSFESDLVTFNKSGDVAAAISGTQCTTKNIGNAVCYRFLAELQRKHLQDIFEESETPPEDLSLELASGMLLNAERAVTINKYDYRNWMVLGNVHTQLSLMGADDTFEKSLDSYDRAIELAPKDPLVLLRKAQLLYYLGKDEAGARVVLTKSLELKSDYLPAKSFLDVLNQVE